MIYKSKAIALHSIRYGDSSIIAYLYSEMFGRISILVHSAYGKSKGTGKAVFFQPLNQLDIVFYRKETQAIAKLKETNLDINYISIPFDPVKRAIALFIGELIYKTVKEEVSNPAMYKYLVGSIQLLDVLHSGSSNYHLLFMMQLTRHLGIYPGNTWSEYNKIFDMKNGIFVHNEPQHPLFLSTQNSQLLSLLMQTPFDQSDQLTFNHFQRNQIIQDILYYYQVHLGSVSDLKSLTVLTEIFKD